MSCDPVTREGLAAAKSPRVIRARCHIGGTNISGFAMVDYRG